jgi:dihydropyrimidine dehydrogenase (NAD+) subunit PreT
MKSLPEGRSEEVFEDFKAPYTPAQARVEANRCLYCYDAPCIKACPTSINIPEFIRKIASENVRGSAKTIFDSNILGMSCARVCPVEVLCVGDCVYNEMGVPPIQIGKLQRFATDAAFDEGWAFYEAGPPSGKSVALLGGGPASLAAAHELRRLGHACTIFEKRPVLGGLNTTGVAPYKMKADRAVDEIEWLLGIGGIEVRTGVEIPRDVDFARLEKDYDAVFLGIGLGVDRLLEVEGASLSGVHGAVDYIEALKLGAVDLSGVESAVVVGGGNTAIDAVRELLGLGVKQVVMAYRGSEPKMSGYAHEWAAAKQEGARGEWQCLPLSFVGLGGQVEAVRCARLDDDKRPIEGSSFDIPAQRVLLAIGQGKLGELVAELAGIAIDNGRIIVDDDGRTGRPGWFAGGDCANGGKEVVNAVAEGKRAAHAIHAHLTGGSHA